MPDDVLGRRILAPDMKPAEVEAALVAIRNVFTLEWLETREELHPLRQLWARTDFIATQELFWLGDSIRSIRNVDSRWLKDATKKVKAFHHSRAGFVFEIIAVSALFRGGHKVVPAKPGTPVFDADAFTCDGAVLRLSFKSFDATAHEQDFKTQARISAHIAETSALFHNRRWFGVAAFCDTFPKEDDWHQLRRALKAVAAGASLPAAGRWKLTSIATPLPEVFLASSRLSYSIQFFAPQHINEAKGFMNKIEGETIKLNSAAAKYDTKMRGVVMIRLSENAALETYAHWAQSYLDQHGVHLSGVILFQTAVALDLEKDTTSIVTSVKAAWRKGVPAPNFTMKFPSCLFSKNQTRFLIMTDGGQFPLEGHHSYTDSQLFPLTSHDLRNRPPVVVRQTPGHTTHLVIRLEDGNEVIFLRDPVPTRLVLFS